MKKKDSMKKKDRIRKLVNKNGSLLKCPVCNEVMFVNTSYSLTCKSNHSFDLSKKGYLNLLISNKVPVYSKELFEARHKVCNSGFYDSLIEALVNVIAKHQNNSSKSITILDAGCGEGSHLYDISKKVSKKDTLVGVDISKESIHMAASNDSDILWCVADLARLPFQNEAFDVILNILSPANYGEFGRLLKENGILIKVVPGAKYLKEIREMLYHHVSTYSNDKVIDYFQQKAEVLEIMDIQYEFPINKELIPHFIKMTPLTWGNSEVKHEKGICDIDTITVDLSILVGKNSIS